MKTVKRITSLKHVPKMEWATVEDVQIVADWLCQQDLTIVVRNRKNDEPNHKLYLGSTSTKPVVVIDPCNHSYNDNGEYDTVEVQFTDGTSIWLAVDIASVGDSETSPSYHRNMELRAVYFNSNGCLMEPSWQVRLRLTLDHFKNMKCLEMSGNGKKKTFYESATHV